MKNKILNLPGVKFTIMCFSFALISSSAMATEMIGIKCSTGEKIISIDVDSRGGKQNISPLGDVDVILSETKIILKGSMVTASFDLQDGKLYENSKDSGAVCTFSNLEVLAKKSDPKASVKGTTDASSIVEIKCREGDNIYDPIVVDITAEKQSFPGILLYDATVVVDRDQIVLKNSNVVITFDLNTGEVFENGTLSKTKCEYANLAAIFSNDVSRSPTNANDSRLTESLDAVISRLERIESLISDNDKLRERLNKVVSRLDRLESSIAKSASVSSVERIAETESETILSVPDNAVQVQCRQEFKDLTDKFYQFFIMELDVETTTALGPPSVDGMMGGLLGEHWKRTGIVYLKIGESVKRLVSDVAFFPNANGNGGAISGLEGYRYGSMGVMSGNGVFIKYDSKQSFNDAVLDEIKGCYILK